jgi:hypothetical protein
LGWTLTVEYSSLNDNLKVQILLYGDSANSVPLNISIAQITADFLANIISVFE